MVNRTVKTHLGLCIKGLKAIPNEINYSMFLKLKK